DGKRWEYVGEGRSDLMGFTVHPSKRGVMYVSGHPNLSSHLPNPIGVMVSRDGGQSWQPLALAGKVDLHAMTIGADGKTLYGWNVSGAPGLYRISVREGTWARGDATGRKDVLARKRGAVRRSSKGGGLSPEEPTDPLCLCSTAGPRAHQERGRRRAVEEPRFLPRRAGCRERLWHLAPSTRNHLRFHLHFGSLPLGRWREAMATSGEARKAGEAMRKYQPRWARRPWLRFPPS